MSGRQQQSSSALSGSSRKSGALSVASSSNANVGTKQRSKGCLEVTVLQLMDLPYKDQVPLGVQFSIVSTLPTASGGDDSKKKKQTNNVTKVWSGPPTQRKGSSFRFPPGVLELVEPLQTLYHSKLKVEVVYNANNNGNSSSSSNSDGTIQPVTLLQGELQLRQLCIHRPKDLALKLKPTKAAASKSNHGSNNDGDGESSNASACTAMVADLEQHPPTIRLRLQLLGPLRPTVARALHYFQLYTQLIDQAQDQLWDPVYAQAIKPILPVLPVGLGLGAVPVVTTTLVVSPMVIGVSLLFFPITLPLVILISMLATGGVGVVSLLLCSTRQGRAMIDDNLLQHDVVQSHVLTSPVTQSVLYDTGDDDAIPNPVSVLRWYVVPEDMWYRLFFSLFIDLVGSLSYLIPVVGESFDGPWGPIQSMLIMALYNQTTPNLKYVSLAEEWLPFTDVLPSATIGWATENMPGLMEEWKDAYEKGGGPAGIAGLLRIGSDDSSTNSSSNSTSSGSSMNNNSKGSGSSNKPGPTPEQKRSILRDMQNYSERLSVKSP